ncbi:hypothetical protein [Salinicoccus sp. Marseille-QA3877]
MDRNQTTVSEAKIKEQVKNDKVKGLIHQILGVLLAFSAFAGVAGFGLDWLNEELINSFGLLLYAIAGFAYTAYTIYKNHFSGKKAQEQNKKLKEEGLK